MRIAHLVTQYPPRVSAGLGRYAEEIVAHQAGEHQVAVFTLNDGRLPRHEQHGVVAVHRPVGRLLGRLLRRRSPPRVAAALLALNILVSNWRGYRLLRRAPERPDVVAVHDATNLVGGLLCHYRLKVPLVFHVHTTEHGVSRRRGLPGQRWVLAAAERWLGRLARKVVVATPEMRQRLTAAGWDGARMEVVWLGGGAERALAGADPAALAAAATALRTRLGIPASAPVLLFVGRLVAHKGIYDLLAAMPALAGAVPGLRLLVVGDGDDGGLARAVAATGLDGQVVTSGFVTGRALLAHYQLADVCVFPSRFEPFGLVATEAMALGKPVVLGAGFSRIFLGDPGAPAARLLAGDGPHEIVAAVGEVFADPRLRRELGENGRRFARRLSWARTAARTVEVYRQAVSGGPPGA